MSQLISKERWREAQLSEHQFWEKLDAFTLLDVIAGMSRHFKILPTERQSALFDGKDVLEIGCGPLGISLASFYSRKDAIRRLVKLDPLKKIDFEKCRLSNELWASGFVAWVKNLSDEGEYVEAAGEDVDFDGCFDTVIIHNVLDHVHRPDEILRRAHRALRAGGTLANWVDCFSAAGRLKFKHITRRRLPNSTLVKAHPFSFRPADVAKLIRESGFHQVEVATQRSLAQDLVGHEFRPLFFGVKN